LAAASLSLLGNPGAAELMAIASSVGLANNFSAVRALIYGGIQKGHMRMHLQKLLNHLGATEEEISAAMAFFKKEMISHTGVSTFLDELREKKQRRT
jgi:hydroxymethylglutaryl-CoA reductase